MNEVRREDRCLEGEAADVDASLNGGRVIFSSTAATLKAFNNLIYMSSLPEVTSPAVVIATQSQLRDYGSKHSVKGRTLFTSVWTGRESARLT